MGRHRKRWKNHYARRGRALYALMARVTAQTRRWEAKKQLFAGREKAPCCFCGRELRYDEATLEHIRPRSRGGSWELKNLTLSCAPCNHRRGDMGYEKFRGLVAQRQNPLPQRGRGQGEGENNGGTPCPGT